MLKNTVEFIKSLYKEKEIIPLHEPKFTGDEKAFVLDTIDSTYVSSIGKYVNLLEDRVKEYTGAKYAVACVNGTSALHLSLILSGVKRDELVITQPLSFISTSNAISYVGSEPVFIDIDRTTLGMSSEKLSEFLEDKCEIKNDNCFHKCSGKKISACVPMHTFGHPAEIDKIVQVCNEFNIPVVEDAAESMGSFYKGTHTGRFGLFGIFSFNGNKIITCGGGGIIITDNEDLGESAKHLSTQAKIQHEWNFSHDDIGYNYRLPNINAAIAVAQLKNLEMFVDNKRELAELYEKFFKNTEIEFFKEPINSRSNYWLNSVLLKDRKARDEFLKYTNEKNIKTRPAWTLLNKLEMYKNCICENIDNSIWIEDRLVNLPSSVRL